MANRDVILSKFKGIHKRKGTFFAFLDYFGSLGFQIDTAGFPDRLFLDVGAAVISAGNKFCFCHGNFFECTGCIGRSFDSSGIIGRSENHEVIVHDPQTIGAVTFRHEFFFQCFGVDKNHIYVAFHSVADGGPGSLGKNFDLDTGLFCEFGKQDIQQSGVLRARGCGHLDDL